MSMYHIVIRINGSIMITLTGYLLEKLGKPYKKHPEKGIVGILTEKQFRTRKEANKYVYDNRNEICFNSISPSIIELIQKQTKKVL